MTRIRTIKPEFWGDEKLAPLPAIHRLVFLGLISFADDAGRMVDSIRAIDGFIFPETEDSARESIDALVELGRVERGVTESGQRVLQLVNWKHQKIDKPNFAAALPPIALGDESSISRRKVDDKVREAIFVRDGGACKDCGIAVRREKRDKYDYARDRASVDHIVAVADGGTDSADNLQLLCFGCNAKKAGAAVRRRNGERSAIARRKVDDVSTPHISIGISTSIADRGAVEPAATATDLFGAFLEQHDFGPFASSVEGLIRAARAPHAVVATLRMHLTGELGHEPATAVELGLACQQFAASGSQFNAAYFAGFVRGAKRGIQRVDTHKRNAAEDRFVAAEHEATRQREEEDGRARKMVMQFGAARPDDYGRLREAAERAVPAGITLGREIIVQAELTQRIRNELKSTPRGPSA